MQSNIKKRYFVNDDIAERICKRKYYQKGEDWDLLSSRVASHVASANEKNKSFWANVYKDLIVDKRFLPGGRILANAGTRIENLSNCYVMEIEDSREGIYDGLKVTAEVHAKGGGIGINFSNLREKDSIIHSTGGKATGPVSFMDLYDLSATKIKQASRRGAMLSMLEVDHPDILEFIDAKRVDGKLENFNISVGATDDFMRAVENNDSYELNTFDGESVRVDAREILHHIAEAMWSSGEPGFIFIDTMNKNNPTPQLGDIICTNPCKLRCTA